MGRLLILSCSARKRGPLSSVPAIDRYDGPAWQVLRSALREQPLLTSDIDVYVLSAAYGLISSGDPIPMYNQVMTPERADELRPEALEKLTRLAQRDYADLCLGLGKVYLQALEGWQHIVPKSTRTTITDRPMGEKLGQLRAWIYGDSWSPSAERPQRLVASTAPPGTAQVKGRTIALSVDEARERVRQALAAGIPGADRFRDWYIDIDGRAVAAKWAVSVLSGLPTSEFDAATAQRVLLALGIDVERATS